MNMTQQEFLDFLIAKGFPVPTLVEQTPLGELDIHVHPFEVMALVLKGSISIAIANQESVYLAGDVFHLNFEEPHSEKYGPNGVQYLASRKG
jgi:quercetin dioxygenase-like cupin family protein